ncbi:hypothetical protein GOP47_0029032 [Adiantum capillus-veneris]|nr:hypothetical protein GOP47_0029032 [Adiantum capillus-veneris]
MSVGSSCGCLAAKQSGSAITLQSVGRLPIVSSSPRPRYLISQGRDSICRRIRCNSNKSFDDNEDGKACNKFAFSLNSATGASKNKCLEITSSIFLQPSILFQLVKETVCSALFIFLVGVVLLLDSAKLLKSEQFTKLQLHEIVVASHTLPFLVSAVTATILGWGCIPFLRRLKAYQIFRIEGPSTHFSKVGTPTMGGLYFIPVGVTVAAVATRASSAHFSVLVAATFAYGAIGLLDDILGLMRKHNYGLPGWCKLFLQVITGFWFCYWLESTNLPTPCREKALVLFPRPLPHLNFGSWYVPFTSFCFASMSNGVNLTDGLDGLAAGTAAAAFLGMSLALSQVYPGNWPFARGILPIWLGTLLHDH